MTTTIDDTPLTPRVPDSSPPSPTGSGGGSPPGDSPLGADGGKPSSSIDGLAVFAAVVALLGVFIAVVAFAFSLSDRGKSGGGASTGEIAATLSDFHITLDKPTVAAGAVVLKVTNTSPTVHNVTVKGLGHTPDLKKGESANLDLGKLEPGIYEMYCAISGHKDLGMTATLTVSGDGGAKVTGGASSGSSATSGSDYKTVDAAHQRVVKEFLTGPPAKTAGLGGQPLKPTVEGGVPVYDLTAKVVQWEVSPGVSYEAWTYNGTVPGPQIRMKQGQTVKVRLKNELPQSTSIHFHGVEIDDNKQDGVTYVTQDPIRPGETYTYTLTPVNCGSHMYHSHHAADSQVPLGLLAAFVIECTTTPVPAFGAHDSEYTEILSDGPLGFGINGKGFPATAPVVAKVGEKTLLRFMNEGLIIHPMHLHGHRMLVVAKDGNYLPAPYEVDTLNIAPGERYDVVVTSLHPGVWAFHCHILTHAESAEGLHGMTTVWVVNP